MLQPHVLALSQILLLRQIINLHVLLLYRVLLLLDLLGLRSDLLVELRPDLPKVLLMEGELELQLLHMLPQLPFLRVILLSDGADQGLVL